MNTNKNKVEGVSVEILLEQLENFLDQTAAITASQIQWLGRSAVFINPGLYKRHKRLIDESINDNIDAAGKYVAALALEGVQICARNNDGWQLPLAGLSYDNDCGHYWAGVKTPDGPVQWPLDGSSQLVVAHRGGLVAA